MRAERREPEDRQGTHWCESGEGRLIRSQGAPLEGTMVVKDEESGIRGAKRAHDRPSYRGVKKISKRSRRCFV